MSIWGSSDNGASYEAPTNLEKTMKRYVIKSEHGYFQPKAHTASIHFDERNYVSFIEDAVWYVTEKNAVSRSTELKEKTKVIPIDIQITEGDAIDYESDLINRYTAIVQEVDKLTNDEVEKLSNAKWNKYKVARRYLREVGLYQ